MKCKYLLSAIVYFSCGLFAMDAPAPDAPAPLNPEQNALMQTKLGKTVLGQPVVVGEGLAKTILDYEALKDALLAMNADQLNALFDAHPDYLKDTFIQAFVCARILAEVARRDNIIMVLPQTCLMGIFNKNKLMRLFEAYAEKITNPHLRATLYSAITRGLWPVLDNNARNTDWVLRMHEFFYALTKRDLVGNADRKTLEQMELPALSAAENKAQAAWRSANLGIAVHLQNIPDAEDNLACATFEMLQKCMRQHPELFDNHVFSRAINATWDENFKRKLLSMPSDTTLDVALNSETVEATLAQAKLLIQSNTTKTTRAANRAALYANRTAKLKIGGDHGDSYLAQLNGLITSLQIGEGEVPVAVVLSQDQVELLRDVFSIVSNPNFLDKDQDSNPVSFPNKVYDQADAAPNSADVKLVQLLGKYVKSIDVSFMQDALGMRLGEVIAYADGLALKPAFSSAKTEREKIALVVRELRKVTVNDTGALTYTP